MTAWRESNRIDLALARGAFLLGIVVMALPAAWGLSRSITLAPAGLILFRAMIMPSTLLLGFLAIRLTSDAVGDGKSGFLDLINMTGTRPETWLLTRGIQIWTGFLSVWLIRTPLLWLAWCLGGVAVEELLTLELLFLILFAVLASFCSVLSHHAESRRQVFQQTLALLFGIETALLLPKLLLSLVTTYTGLALPRQILSFGQSLEDLRFTTKFRSLFTSSFSWSYGADSLLMYTGLAVAGMMYLWWTLFQSLEDRGASPAKGGFLGLWADRKHSGRVSRRSWDEAFAWQAYHIHSAAGRVLTVKWMLYLAFVCSLPWLIDLGYTEPAVVSGLFFCGGGLFMAVNKPGDCLQRELKEQTLTSLTLTPHDPTDLYAGWRSGAWRMCWPDFLFAPLLLGLSAWMVPSGGGQGKEIAFVIPLTIGLAILSGGPFMMLSPLVPFTRRGVATGLFLIGIPIVITIVAGVLTAVLKRPVLFPVLAIPSWSLFNFWLKHRMLPYWLAEKVSAIA